jgi:EamA domain-containing membrane protein RarD
MKINLSPKQISALGWAATCITILSFTVSDMLLLRIINLAGCFTWITYGLLRKDKPIIATNFLIAVIHFIKLFLPDQL